MIRNRTPHVTAAWLYASDLAAELDITRQYAARLIKRIPGAEMLYRYDGRRGERWRVSRAAFAVWRAAVA